MGADLDDLLNRFAVDVYSQAGEDGVIEHVLDTIGERDGWCVEFGAWDGLHLSNCANLLRNRDYSGVLIEASAARFRELTKNYVDFPKVTVPNAFVGFRSSDNLDSLLEDVAIPERFDFLSIDIDGNDFHVWKAISRFRPKVVCIEFNPTIPNEVDFVQAADPRVQHGSSPSALTKLGSGKGYELVCVLPWNLVFVDREYFSVFGIADNSLENLRRDLSRITYLFTTQDGHVLLSGDKTLPWHRLPIDEHRLQQLPPFLRKYPDDYSSFQDWLFRAYRRRRRYGLRGLVPRRK